MPTLTAARARSDFPVAKTVGAGTSHTAWGVYALTVNPTAGDIIQMCRIPAGAVVTGGSIYGSDLDTGVATLNLSVGWADNGVDVASAAGLGALGVVTGDAVAGIKPGTGIWMPLQGTLFTSGPIVFAAETIIQVTVVAAAATFAAGSLTVVVHYTNP